MRAFARLSGYRPLSQNESRSNETGLPLPVTAGSSSSGSGARHQPSSSTYPPPGTAARTDKGKRRQEDVSSSGIDDDRPKTLSFCVRFTNEAEDLLDFWVTDQETVRDVKRRLRQLRPSLVEDGRPKRLRLIQLGRLMTDGTFLVPYTLSLLDRRKKAAQASQQGVLQDLEAVTRELVEVAVPSRMSVDVQTNDVGHDEDGKNGKGKGKASNSNAKTGEDEKIWLQASVGAVMDDDEIESERPQAEAEQIKPLQGFDRLRDAGFTEDEIAELRQEFRANAGGRRTEGSGAEDEDEHARALEDQWMEGLTSQADPDYSTANSNEMVLFKGMAMGFFVPFLPLFFLRGPTFSPEMSIAVVLGSAINLGFGVLRALS